MTVTVVGTPTELSDSSSPFTFADATHMSGSGTNRAIVAAISHRSDTATPKTIDAVTWNGVAMTKAVAVSYTDNTTSNIGFGVDLWYLLAPDASTAGQFSVTPSSTPNRIMLIAMNLQADAAIAFDTFGSGSDDADPGTTAVTGNITTGQANALVIGGLVFRDGTISVSSWSDMTELADIIETSNAHRLYTAHAAQASAGADSYGATLSSADEWAFALASFYETAAAAGRVRRANMMGNFQDRMRGRFLNA